GPCVPTSSCATRSSNRCLPGLCVPSVERQRTKARSISTTSGSARNSTEPLKPSALRRLEKFARQRQHVGVRCSISAYFWFARSFSRASSGFLLPCLYLVPKLRVC